MPLLTSQGAALSSHLIRFRLITLAYSAYLNLLYAPLLTNQGVPLGGLFPALGRKGLPDPDLDR